MYINTRDKFKKPRSIFLQGDRRKQYHRKSEILDGGLMDIPHWRAGDPHMGNEPKRGFFTFAIVATMLISYMTERSKKFNNPNSTSRVRTISVPYSSRFY